MKTTKQLTITAMFIALTYIFTSFVNIRLPIAANGGLVHLGNVPLFICAVIYGKKSGAAPFTFVICGLMGFTIGAITEKHHGIKYDLLAFAAACIIKIAGYYIAEGIIYGNWLAPAASIPGNLVQIGVASVIVLLVVEKLRVLAYKISPELAV